LTVDLGEWEQALITHGELIAPEIPMPFVKYVLGDGESYFQRLSAELRGWRFSIPPGTFLEISAQLTKSRWFRIDRHWIFGFAGTTSGLLDVCIRSGPKISF
jgi:hypothetical protein